FFFFFFFQAEDGIRDYKVTEVQTCALPISATFGPSLFHLPAAGWNVRLASPTSLLSLAVFSSACLHRAALKSGSLASPGSNSRHFSSAASARSYFPAARYPVAQAVLTIRRR